MGKNDVARRISRDEMKVMNKYKGEAFSGEVHIRDSETKEELYTNKDVRDVAAFSVKRCGAEGNTNYTDWSQLLRLVEDNWMEQWECPKCHNKQLLFISSIYEGQLFADGTRGMRCQSCWADFELKEISEEKQKELYNKSVWIDKYVNLGCNDFEGRKAIMEEYLKDCFRNSQELKENE